MQGVLRVVFCFLSPRVRLVSCRVGDFQKHVPFRAVPSGNYARDTIVYSDKLKHDTTVSCLGVGTFRHGTITALPACNSIYMHPASL
jgi:hypothetical protein